MPDRQTTNCHDKNPRSALSCDWLTQNMDRSEIQEDRCFWVQSTTCQMPISSWNFASILALWLTVDSRIICHWHTSVCHQTGCTILYWYFFLHITVNLDNVPVDDDALDIFHIKKMRMQFWTSHFGRNINVTTLPSHVTTQQKIVAAAD